MSVAGIAAGTLLYVVMFEVLSRERERDISGILQLAGVIVGFGVMLTIECLGKRGSAFKYHVKALPYFLKVKKETIVDIVDIFKKK